MIESFINMRMTAIMLIILSLTMATTITLTLTSTTPKIYRWLQSGRFGINDDDHAKTSLKNDAAEKFTYACAVKKSFNVKVNVSSVILFYPIQANGKKPHIR